MYASKIDDGDKDAIFERKKGYFVKEVGILNDEKG